MPKHMNGIPIAHLNSPGNFLAISGTEGKIACNGSQR